jgi:hypothetical protein
VKKENNLSTFLQSKLFRQSKNHLYNEIRTIILDYCDGLIEYKQFSYKISPYIFDACDGKIKNEKVKNILIQVMYLLEDYLNYEITTQQKLKYNLRHLVEK